MKTAKQKHLTYTKSRTRSFFCYLHKREVDASLIEPEDIPLVGFRIIKPG